MEAEPMVRKADDANAMHRAIELSREFRQNGISQSWATHEIDDNPTREVLVDQHSEMIAPIQYRAHRESRALSSRFQTAHGLAADFMNDAGDPRIVRGSKNGCGFQIVASGANRR